MSRMLWLLIIVGLLLLAACSAEATPVLEPATVSPLGEPVPAKTDLAYVPDGTEKQVLDLYLPENGNGPFPVVFMLHGANSNKRDPTMRQMAELALEQGYAAISIEYRMGGTPDQPLPLQDTFCALAWVSSNAGEYNLDPDGVVPFGHSLSGLFVGKLATIDDPTPFLADCPHQLSEADWLRGVMTFGGVLGAPGAMLGESSFIAEMIGKSYGMETQWVFEHARGLPDVPPAEWANSEQLDEEQRALAQLLPPYSVDGSEPPFLLMAGVDDPIMMDEAQAFASLLETAGVPVQYVTLPDTGHRDFGDEVLWQSLVSAFLTDVLAK